MATLPVKPPSLYIVTSPERRKCLRSRGAQADPETPRMLPKIQVSVRRSLKAILIVVGLVWAIGPAGRAAAPGDSAPPAGDALLLALSGEDYDTARLPIERALRSRPAPPCELLGAFAGQRNERVRENAVRAMLDSGCGRFGDYHPYLDDTSPWVTGAVLRAIERHLMTDAVPYLIERLGDPRRVISGEGSWTIAEAAHRALRAVTCQSFHFDPRGTDRSRLEAIEAWREWYAAHRGERREAWVAAGLALARDYVARDYAPHRAEGIQLLAVIGPAGLSDLRAAFDRAAGDLRARLACTPDGPPRVTEGIPCVLEVVNVSSRRVALAPAPGPPDVLLTRQQDPGAAPQGAKARTASPARKETGRGHGAKKDAPAPAVPAPSAANPAIGAPSPAAAPDLAEIARDLIDLAPGESLRREFLAGPVQAAGRYEVKAEIRDLSARLRAGEGAPSRGAKAVPPSPPLVASVVIRFEQ